jgi:predicted nucleic-acid-binding protein
MLAIDTNLVVRYLTDDDPRQSAKARALIDGENIFVATTVFLETEWVLRSLYGHSSAQISVAFGAFAGLPNVTLEDPPLVAAAISWMGEGLDFADALHLGAAAAQACDAFVTFDRGLMKTGEGLSGMSVREP